MKIYIAFDLGTKTGYAVGNQYGLISSGVLNLAEKGRFSARGFNLFQTQVAALLHRYDDKDEIEIAVEKPHCGQFYHADRILFGLMGVLNAVAEGKGAEVATYSPNTIKKFWAWNGHATKNGMLDATEENLGFRIKDHNQNDAVALLYYVSGADFNE